MTHPKINTGVSTMPIQYQPGPLSCTNIAFLTACPTTLRWTARPKPVKEPSFRRTGSRQRGEGNRKHKKRQVIVRHTEKDQMSTAYLCISLQFRLNFNLQATMHT